MGDLGIIFVVLVGLWEGLGRSWVPLGHLGGVLGGLGWSFGCLLEHLGGAVGALRWSFEWS